MKKYTCLVLDNLEENILHTNQMLRQYCKNIGDIYSATTVENGEALCLEHTPELLFIDINLKNSLPLFRLLENLPDPVGEVIFMSFSHQYASEAIAHNASSYLLKPYTTATFVKAVNKAKVRTNTKRKMLHFMAAPNNLTLKSHQIIAISTLEHVYLVHVDNILYCLAEGGYTRFILKNLTEHLSSKGIGAYEEILSSSPFFRIHHKYLVNVNHINFIDKKNGYYCCLKNGQKLPIAKRRQEDFNHFLLLNN